MEDGFGNAETRFARVIISPGIREEGRVNEKTRGTFDQS